MLRSLSAVFLTVIVAHRILFAQNQQENSQAPEADPPEQLSAEELKQFGQEVYQLASYRDNVFLYDRVAKELETTAQTFAGTAIEFRVKVERVLRNEVLVEVVQSGRTRFALAHDTAPRFGNMRSVSYSGSATTQRANILSQLPGLRIGPEIPLELARGLRDGHVLNMRGTIEKIILKHRETFAPDSIAIIVNWEAINVVPSSRYLPL